MLQIIDGRLLRTLVIACLLLALIMGLFLLIGAQYRLLRRGVGLRLGERNGGHTPKPVCTSQPQPRSCCSHVGEGLAGC